MTETPIAVRMHQVDVLFGESKRQAEALRLLDSGATRDDILSKTGVVLGVADASLDVPTGSISVLMGLSGSGKSSLLRCVNGLNTVTRGVLEVTTPEGAVNVATARGGDLRQLRRHNLAMVFQQFGLLPWATVRENIGFGLSVRGESESVIRDSVDQQLELVGLEAWADKAIHTLSGGMQQRVGLARAFATDADILLMDEPFSALDPLIREHLQDELLALQSRLKKTILFVSHDLDEALKLGNQISIMDGGRIVQTGTASDIVFAPSNEYVRRFVANINPLSILTASSVMQPVQATGDELQHDASGLTLQLRDRRAVSGLFQGNACDLRPVAADAAQPALESSASPVIYCVPEQTSIKLLLKLATDSLCPILVVDAAGQPCGVITARDLMVALRDDAA